MAKLTGQQIREKARAIIAENPGGIRFGALKERILKDDAETNPHTIDGSIWDLEKKFSAEISNPVAACISQQMRVTMRPLSSAI